MAKAATDQKAGLSISAKLGAVILLFVLGLGLVTWVALFEMRSQMMHERSASLQNLVQSVDSLLGMYAKKVEAGELSLEQAQSSALAEIKQMRYQSNQYFWVNDMTPRMVMHPMKPELDGTLLTNTADPDGKHLFVEMVRVVTAQGSGFVDYMWAKPGEEEPQPKISYVQGFKPWGWIVGTGVYVDDINKSMIHLTLEFAQYGFAILIVILLAAVPMIRGITKATRSLTSAMMDLAHGRLDIDIPGLNRTDELGHMASALAIFKENASKVDELQREATQRDALSARERKVAMHKMAEDFEQAVGEVSAAVSRAAAELHQYAE